MTGPLGAPGFIRPIERQDVVVETSTLKVIFRNVAVAGDDEVLGVARVK